MERWFSNNSEDTSKLSVDDKEAASGPMPTESPKKLSDTSLTEIGPPLATSSLGNKFFENFCQNMYLTYIHIFNFS